MQKLILLLLVASASITSISHAAEPTVQKRFTVHIGRQPLIDAVVEFSRQTKLLTVFVGPPPPDTVMADEVIGELTSEEIFDRMTDEYDATFLSRTRYLRLIAARAS